MATNRSVVEPAAADSGLALKVPGCFIFGLPGRNSRAAKMSARPVRHPPGKPPASTLASVVRSGVTP